jgi:hypothetical protein
MLTTIKKESVEACRLETTVQPTLETSCAINVLQKIYNVQNNRPIGMLYTDVLYQHVLKMTVCWDVATCSLVETG